MSPSNATLPSTDAKHARAPDMTLPKVLKRGHRVTWPSAEHVRVSYGRPLGKAKAVL